MGIGIEMEVQVEMEMGIELEKKMEGLDPERGAWETLPQTMPRFLSLEKEDAGVRS